MAENEGFVPSIISSSNDNRAERKTNVAASKKRATIEQIYQSLKDRAPEPLIFDNQMVKQITQTKGFGNQFDATKFDQSAKLPEALRNDDRFILHLGSGCHCFAKGVSIGYHRFETIADDEVEQRKYKPYALNGLDTSEAGTLSLAFNQRIVQLFLYDDIVASPLIYLPRRTKASFEIILGEQRFNVEDLQIERDLTIEHGGEITVFEAKNGKPLDFNVFQLYNPYRYLKALLTGAESPYAGIRLVYLVKGPAQKHIELALWEYTFEDELRPDSIVCRRKRKYILSK